MEPHYSVAASLNGKNDNCVKVNAERPEKQNCCSPGDMFSNLN